MRLFFALWPDEATQQQWSFASDSIIKTLGGRHALASNLHLTLHFLGEVDGSRVGALTRLGDDIVCGKIDLHFDRVECWRQADIACLRPTSEPATLKKLVGNLGSGLALAGFPVEKHRFKAHVTIARQLNHHDAALPLWPAIDWKADTLALVRSRLTPTGPVYDPIGLWALE